MIVTAKHELPERELTFVRMLAEGHPATKAATLAGYSVSHAVYLLRKPRILAALDAFHENTGEVLRAIQERKPYGADPLRRPDNEDEAA